MQRRCQLDRMDRWQGQDQLEGGLTGIERCEGCRTRGGDQDGWLTLGNDMIHKRV